MSFSKNTYRWFYDNIQSRYYDLMLRWCMLPLGGEDKVRRELVDVIDVHPGAKILDMCCGTGSTTFILADKVGGQGRISAIDLSTGQIEKARKKNRSVNIDFSVMDAENTSFLEDEFDFVFIPHALHELERNTRLAILKEARRILRHGGMLVVLEMDTPSTLFWRLCIAFFWFYWLPFNPETPTRKDLNKHGLVNEIGECLFNGVTKVSKFHGSLQVVFGTK